MVALHVHYKKWDALGQIVLIVNAHRHYSPRNIADLIYQIEHSLRESLKQNMAVTCPMPVGQTRISSFERPELSQLLDGDRGPLLLTHTTLEICKSVYLVCE